MEKGYDVYAIVPKGKYFHKFTDDKIQTLEYSLDRKGLNPFKELSTIISLYKLFRSRKFDLLHTYTLKPNLYGTIAAKLAGIPVIINSVTGLGYIYTEKGFKARVMPTLKHKDESIEAGREYVEAYVDFMHYVEKLYNTASKSAGHHEHEEESGEHHGN